MGLGRNTQPLMLSYNWWILLLLVMNSRLIHWEFFWTSPRLLTQSTMIFFWLNFPFMESEVLPWSGSGIILQTVINLCILMTTSPLLKILCMVFHRDLYWDHSFFLFILMILINHLGSCHLFYLQMIQTYFILIEMCSLWSTQLIQNSLVFLIGSKPTNYLLTLKKLVSCYLVTQSSHFRLILFL